MSQQEDVELFTEEGSGSPAEIAKRLRDLATMIESKRFTMGDISVELPELLDYELELEREDDNGEAMFELEFELSWSVGGDEDDDGDEDLEDEAE